MIRYLRHNEIDLQAWDDCIKRSGCAHPYALSFYLNAVCKRWDALVFKNYEAVMPLPVARKLALWYIYQPYFTQQLGIFSHLPVTEEMVQLFLKAIPNKFIFKSLHLHSGNQVEKNKNKFTFRKNYLLSLQQSLELIEKNYKQNTKRNIAKALKSGLVVKKNAESPESYASFFQQQNTFKGAKDAAKILLSLLLIPQNKLPGFTLGVYTQENELVAMSHYIQFANRIIYLAPASSPKGKECNAAALLIHAVIEEFSGTSLTLDFEGSEIESVARFYSGFGADPEYYPAYRNMLNKK